MQAGKGHTAGGGARPADASALAPDGGLRCGELREREEGNEAQRGLEGEHGCPTRGSELEGLRGTLCPPWGGLYARRG